MSFGLILILILGFIVIVIMVFMIKAYLIDSPKNFAKECKFECVSEEFCKTPVTLKEGGECSEQGLVCCQELDKKAYEKTSNYLDVGESETFKFGDISHKVTIKEINNENVKLEISSTPQTIDLPYNEWKEIMLDDGKYSIRALKFFFYNAPKIRINLNKDMQYKSPEIKSSVISLDYVIIGPASRSEQKKASSGEAISVPYDSKIIFKIGIKNPYNDCVAYITHNGNILTYENGQKARVETKKDNCGFFSMEFEPGLVQSIDLANGGTLKFDVIAFNSGNNCKPGGKDASKVSCWNSSFSATINIGLEIPNYAECPMNQMIITALISPDKYCKCGIHLIGEYTGYSCIYKENEKIPEKLTIPLCPQNMLIISNLIDPYTECLCGVQTITANQKKVCLYDSRNSQYYIINLDECPENIYITGSSLCKCGNEIIEPNKRYICYLDSSGAPIKKAID